MHGQRDRDRILKANEVKSTGGTSSKIDCNTQVLSPRSPTMWHDISRLDAGAAFHRHRIRKVELKSERCNQIANSKASDCSSWTRISLETWGVEAAVQNGIVIRSHTSPERSTGIHIAVPLQSSWPISGRLSFFAIVRCNNGTPVIICSYFCTYMFLHISMYVTDAISRMQ